MRLRLIVALACGFLCVGLFMPTANAQGQKLLFANIWNSHPLNNSETFPARMLKEEVVGGVVKPIGSPSFANQCAIRMGVALREAGVTLGQIGSPRVSWYHPKDRMFVLNAQELANGLKNARIEGLGKMIKVQDPATFHKELFGKKGIVFFKDYWRRSGETNPTGDHIDVWNGYRTSAKWLMEWFSWLGYNENYGYSKEIWFWEVESE